MVVALKYINFQKQMLDLSDFCGYQSLSIHIFSRPMPGRGGGRGRGSGRGGALKRLNTIAPDSPNSSPRL